ncbi:hypothetical protein [Yeosuana marina]|uniref:hypothetical protein n=1 Tax=Yeosuana marina TaxID=1565536 RepID=UPI0030EF7D2D|tara:strand:- start:13034 stop:14587 length:1554 start_codon:yes stop_codon:yes gene_type:complete
MKRLLYVVFLVSMLFLYNSCRKDFEFSPSTGSLQFSKDTIYLDTVFSNIGSSTYNFKVYNRSDNDIIIPTVKLGLGDASAYRLNVDGMAGKTFENVEILAKDSLYIFVETTVDIANHTNLTDYLYTDQIEFDTNSNQQKVELVTLVKDAIFIYPNRDNTTKVVETLTLNIGGESIETDIQGRELLPAELTFTNEKPYVIYGFAATPSGETITINPGARLHFHENSGLLITEGSSIKIQGGLSTDQEAMENQVILEGDRLEPGFSETPGQWNSIWLLDGSLNNEIHYTTIKNATVGVLSDGNPNESTDKLTITNSQIYNSSAFGILGRNTSINGENVVINNSGQSSFAGTIGGKYNFTHSTIANYWDNGFRQYPAVLLNNFIVDTDNNTVLADLTEANFNNCIIYGNDNPEILLDEIEDATVSFNFKFTNCLIRFEDNSNNFTGANYDLNNTNHYEGNLFNQSPDFKNTSLNEMIIGDKSAAINQGNSIFSNQVPFDILNINRTSSPDIGAYQHVTFP